MVREKIRKLTFQARESSLAVLAIFAPWTTNENSAFCQLLPNLRARLLVIPTHFLVFESSIDSFFGLTEQGKFVTKLIRHSFLIKRAMPERLTNNPSLFKVLNIPAGWKPWFYRSSI